jgi:hypothetical protein
LQTKGSAANPQWSTTVTSVDVSGGTTGLTTSGGPITSTGTITLAGTLAIANGGTGQTTSSAAFNALSPITSTGDLIIGNGTNSATRLAIGPNTYVLASNGTTASWQPASGGGSGTVAAGTAGQLTYYGSTGTTVSGNANATISGGALTLGVAGTTAGSLLFSGSTSGAVTVKSAAAAGTWTMTLPTTAGTNGYVLSTDGTGVTSWIATSGGGGTVTSVNVSGGTTGLTTSGGPVTGSGTITLAGTLAIANGGTGQTTASAGFNALSPITSTGDLIIGNGTNSATRLGIGTNGYVLTSNGTTATWAASTGGVTSFSAGSTGLTPNTATTGAITLAGTLGVANGGTGATTLTGYVKGSGTSALTAASTIPNTDITGLGTMSVQAATSVAITGGTINGTSVGATTPSTGAFTSVSANLSTTGALSAGAYSYGSLSYSDTGIFASYNTSTNSYAQIILANGSAGAAASTDFIVGNNNTTATTYFGDFGMNSSAFSGTGSLSAPNAVFLSSTSSDLVIGTTTSNAIRFVVNSGATDAMTIGTSGAITTGTWNGSAIGIAYGGTGQTTASAAFNALSPITTTGDLIIGNGTNSATRLGIGANSYVLTSNGTTASWAAPTTSSSSYTRTSFTATGGQTTFSVTYTVGYIQVYLNGVLLNASDYTASNGTSVVLAVAASSGDIVETIAMSVTSVAIPGTYTRTTITATAGQTSFTATYTVNYVQVYVNGMLLNPSDYTATSGTAVVLGVAASAGDLIDVVALTVGPVTGGAFITGTPTAGTLTSWTNSTAIQGFAPSATGDVPFSTDGTTFASTQKIVRGTSVATTSGTSIDFTGIPSWAKRITVMFNGVGTNGSQSVIFQIGSGSVTTTGYLSYVATSSNSGSVGLNATNGFITGGQNSSNLIYGTVTIFLYSGFNYVSTVTGSINSAGTYGGFTGAGTLTLSGAMDRVRITTANGVPVFNAGSINILYE